MTKIINLGTSAFYELQEARLIEFLWDVLPKGNFKIEFGKFITENIFKL